MYAEDVEAALRFWLNVIAAKTIVGFPFRQPVSFGPYSKSMAIACKVVCRAVLRLRKSSSWD